MINLPSPFPTCIVGQPWTADEHACFLQGLSDLGRGKWRAVSKNYVPSRTPTQIASHAQKYFQRMTSSGKRKVRVYTFKERRTHFLRGGARARSARHPIHLARIIARARVRMCVCVNVGYVGVGMGKTLRLTTLCIHLGSCAEREMHLCVCDICVCTVALHGN